MLVIHIHTLANTKGGHFETYIHDYEYLIKISIQATARTEATKGAKKYLSMMPVIIAKSCNIILVEKTYWKSAALTAI